MEDRRTISDILLASGRIQESDVDRALAHQREHGGFLGEALVDLGMASREEIEWSLASQLDIPYVVPEAESVDPDTVRLVTPEWALANLTVPIMLADDVLTVVMDQPERRAAAEELGRRMECEVSLSLASPANIRRLIREIFGLRAVPGDAGRMDLVTLTEGLGMAVATGARRFGVSRRGPRSVFWFDDQGTVRRIPMMPGWLSDLDGLTEPAIGPRIHGRERTAFDTELNLRGIQIPLGVRFLTDDSGDEFLFLPRETASPGVHFDPPPSDLLSELRLLCRQGTPRFLVTTDPAELGHELMPHLADLLFQSDRRGIYVSEGTHGDASRAFNLRMSGDDDLWSNELTALRDFAFDVVTVDLEGALDAWGRAALAVAPVALLLWPPDHDLSVAAELDIRWQLHVTEGAGHALGWTLEPLRT